MRERKSTSTTRYQPSETTDYKFLAQQLTLQLKEKDNTIGQLQKELKEANAQLRLWNG